MKYSQPYIKDTTVEIPRCLLTYYENGFNTEQIPFGLPPIIGNYYFPKLSKQLLDQDILQHLKIIRDGSENLLRQIRLGQIDIGIIGSINPLTEDDLKSELLKEKKFQIIVADLGS
ncbi:hypothetical protein P7G51_11420 [Enterococcus asini]|uniref:hypothetical protein n=1 Tax=Enterococcus asini TaxID=57732 RepID=UPI00288DBFD4|nr:hypothetical protein [Enterococcus asini]MDT2757991.1 hypothetical protein [Enterococcus asini]